MSIEMHVCECVWLYTTLKLMQTHSLYKHACTELTFASPSATPTHYALALTTCIFQPPKEKPSSATDCLTTVHVLSIPTKGGLLDLDFINMLQVTH